MSRSNSSQVPPGGVSTRPARQLNPLPPHQPLPHGAAPPAGYPPAHAHPGHGGADPYAAQGYAQAPAAAARQPNYAPQFDAYTGQPQQGYAQYDPGPGAGGLPQSPQQPAGVPSYELPLSQPAAYANPPPGYGYAAAPDPARAAPPAFDPWTQPAAPSPHAQQLSAYQALAQPEARSFESAGYPQGQADPGYASAGYPQPAAGDWGAQQPYGQAYAQPYAQGYPPPAEPSLDAGGYHPDHHPQAHADGSAYGGQPQAGQELDGEYNPEDDGYYAEDTPGKPWMKIAAVLVGAIVVGGGLTFAYTSLIGGDGGTPPVIKSAGGPTKIKPADAGGKKFANADSKIMGRLNDPGGDADASGVKKVSTVPIGPDGAIVPPAEAPAVVTTPAAEPASAAPASATSASDTSFPGGGATVDAPVPPTSTAEGPVTVTPPKALDKPVEIAAVAAEKAKPVTPTVTNSITAAAAAKPAAPPAPPPVKKLVATAPAAATAAAPAVKKPIVPIVAAPSGAGYVAVLASVPVSTTSRINALKQFADMQQKFGTVLQNKTPDVREADLGEKGSYHRLLVGPPGSREGAQALCGSLKAAGYGSDCWVTAY
ncbi:MAG: SPOR domain-containing protein [Hyphomicrobium sp.]